MIRQPASPIFADRHGFGTLEAIVSLLVASLTLTAITVVATHSIDRARRAEAEFRQGMALEKISACIPRISRPTLLSGSGSSSEPHPCLAVQAGLDVVPGAGPLRAVRTRDGSGKTLLFLQLEGDNP